jgi:aminomethyltransferase
MLLRQKEKGIARKLVGFEMTEKGIPRHGYEIYNPSGEKIGQVTSGTMSPSLGKGIGLGYVTIGHEKAGSELFIQIRDKLITSKVIKLPFYKNQ